MPEMTKHFCNLPGAVRGKMLLKVTMEKNKLITDAKKGQKR